MQHIDEHTIELYVLGSERIEEQREQIEAHFIECYGCRTLAEQMGAFYRGAEEQLREVPQPEKDVSKALVRTRQNIVPYCEPYAPPVPYRPTSVAGRFGYFVRRHPVLAGVGGFSFAAALVVLGMMISSPFKRSDSSVITDHNPALTNYNATTEMLEVLNAKHQLLWQRKSPSIGVERERENQNHIYVTSIGDLNGDGSNEVVTGLNILGNETTANDRHLLVFDADGTLLWKKKFIETVHYLNRTYSSHFNVQDLLVMEDNVKNRKNIVVVANNEGRSPSLLHRLDNSGNIIGTYWHFGMIVGLYQRDLDGDGTQELILCGKNDVNDTTKQEFAFVAVLDPSKIVGERRATTCPGYSMPPSDAELYYLKFPQVDIDRVNRTSSGITTMTESDSSTFKFVMTSFNLWSFDYFLDRDLRVLRVKSYDHTEAFHKDLEERGKLSGTIDAGYLENLKNGVRYWDGREWRKEPIRIDHRRTISMR